MSDMAKEQYLGDGLYASFDGWMLTLRAPREAGDHWVAFEPETMKAFLLYIWDLAAEHPKVVDLWHLER